MKCIRQVLRKEQDRITRLRITEFGRSREFSLLRPEQLEWNRCDDQHVVLAALDAPEMPVSTMRAVMIADTDEAAATMECTPPPQVRYPALIFNSAATLKSHRGLGLNQALRYHFLLGALRSNIRTILSPIYEGAPRIGFMVRLGYEFKTPERSWQTKLAPKCRRIVGLLHQSKLTHAIDYLKAERANIIKAYPYKGEPVFFSACQPD